MNDPRLGAGSESAGPRVFPLAITMWSCSWLERRWMKRRNPRQRGFLIEEAIDR
jgi:hypothetical protein